MSASNIAKVLGQGAEEKRGAGFLTLCPCHNDHDPSLHVSDGTDGVALTCYAGCDREKIREELQDRGLLPRPPETQRWIYHDAQGLPVGLVERVDKPNGDKIYPQSRYEAGSYIRGLNGTKLPLYRLPRVLEAIQAGRTIYVVEGEKCADSLVGIGLDATTSPGGAGKWRAHHAEPLKDARVMVLPDNDDPGRKHAQQVARSLAGIAAEVRLVELPGLPPAGDVYDWLRAGGTRAKLEALAEAAGPAEPKAPGIAARDLMALDLPVPSYVVRDLIPEGLSLLVGPPKIGKSWLILSIGVSVAAGGPALGSIATRQGPVLVLALEDSRRRVQTRLRMILDGEPAPEALHIVTLEDGWPRPLPEGLQDLASYIKEKSPRLIVLDTLGRLRRAGSGRQNAYHVDVDELGPLQGLVQGTPGLALVGLHHDTKAKGGDFVDAVSGSRGVSGTADSVLTLTRTRGQGDAELRLTGRDVAESELALRFDPSRGVWTVLGSAQEYRQTEERREVLDVLRGADGPMTPKEVAEALGKAHGAVRRLLPKLHKAGLLSKGGKGAYSITQSGYTHGNPGNSSNSGNTGNSGNSEVPVTASTGELPHPPSTGNSPSPQNDKENPSHVTELPVLPLLPCEVEL